MSDTPSAAGQPSGDASERIVIRDKRKVDRSGAMDQHAGSDKPESAGAPTGAAAGPSSTTGDPTAEESTTDETAAEAVTEATEGGTNGVTSGDGRQSSTTKGATEAPPSSPGKSESGGKPESAAKPESGGGRHSRQPDHPNGGSAPGVAPPTGLGAELEALRAELDERTRDLQRVTAEYANYRKRVDRDRGVAAEQTTGSVLAALLPVLDDLDRAREHGDLVGPFGAVAEQLNAALTKFGLTAFGDKGDPFDPTRHEAVAHLKSPDVTEPTCIDVMRRGYLLGERLLRPALVAVADPE
jgi:molecular chaperone GrpE